ncbi:MAG: hypothetical protein KTR17_06295 [Cellvibrionaceae bacterium]|nr:hypothetical protein [Cellvibrionaceae bacterium]
MLADICKRLTFEVFARLSCHNGPALAPALNQFAVANSVRVVEFAPRLNADQLLIDYAQAADSND